MKRASDILKDSHDRRTQASRKVRKKRSTSDIFFAVSHTEHLHETSKDPAVQAEYGAGTQTARYSIQTAEHGARGVVNTKLSTPHSKRARHYEAASKEIPDHTVTKSSRHTTMQHSKGKGSLGHISKKVRAVAAAFSVATHSHDDDDMGSTAARAEISLVSRAVKVMKKSKRTPKRDSRSRRIFNTSRDRNRAVTMAAKTKKRQEEVAFVQRICDGAFSRCAQAFKGIVHTVSAALHSFFVPGVLTLLPVLILVIAAIGLGAVIGKVHADSQKASLLGVPSEISYEMVDASFDLQEKYGVPVSVTLGQIILESGIPLSKLATEDKNLFGIKYYSFMSGDSRLDDPPYHIWQTQEHGSDNTTYTVDAGFARFKSYRDCIAYRGEMYLKKPYSTIKSIVEGRQKCDYKLVAQGLQEAGYATSQTYAVDLISLIEKMGFARFDKLTKKDFSANLHVIHGQDYASADERGKAIVDAASKVPSPGLGWCAQWVTQVYTAAGQKVPSGHAYQMYERYCTSSDPADLKVGMIIATPHSGADAVSYTYGHVGIYIGNNRVIHNSGEIEITPLGEWISRYAYQCHPRWGFPE